MADLTPPSSKQNTPMRPLDPESEESSPPARSDATLPEHLRNELDIASADEGMDVDQFSESSDGEPEHDAEGGEQAPEEVGEEEESEEDKEDEAMVDKDKGKGKAVQRQRPAGKKTKGKKQPPRKGKDGQPPESEIVDRWNHDFGDVGLSSAPPFPVAA